MADALEYLSPDYDLNTLTVPRLRSILVNHDIPYPASAKKAQLIRILQDEVLPQARKLLRERERVKRTSEGITDMGSRASSVVSSDVEGRESATPSAAATPGRNLKRGRPKRSTRASTFDEEDAGGDEGRLMTPMAESTTARKSGSSRRTRSSEIPFSVEPEVKSEPVDEDENENVFTDDNPFQSGSPEIGSGQQRRRIVSRDGARKSGSKLSPGDSAGLHARKSETPVSVKKERVSPAKRSSYESRASLPSPMEESDEEDEDDDEVAAGEEFTPDEQLELERAQAALYPTTPRRTGKEGTASKWISWLVILSMLGSFGAWWRTEKIEIGFCGIGKPTWSLADTNVPEWANVLEPRCEVCPAHAFCYPNFEVRCEHDFILKPHPLSFGGLIPLPPTCEPDSEKARRVKAVSEKAVEQLRERRAKWECGELADDGKETKTPEMSEPDLKQTVGQKRRKGMSDIEFDDLWKGALGEILGKDEVISKTKQPSSVLTLTSTSVTRLPLTCAFRRYIRLSLVAYRLPLSAVILLACVLTYARSRVLARRSDLARVPELVATTLDRLATQAALHARGGGHEPYIPIGQLRDDVLRSELRGSRREELWGRVRRVVEGNANIRAAVREGRGGDVSRVWEWIGGIGGVSEGEGSGRRRESSNMMVSPDQQYKTDTESPHITARNPIQSRHWDEGRPVY